MTTTTESSGINSTKGRRRAMGVLVAGAAAVALFALFGTTLAGAAETTVASGPVQLVDQATAPPLRVQDVDDSDDDANNAMQAMIQSEQQAEEQNEQAEQQFIQDELQAQQTEQQANQ
jgi:hypothetical protein